MDWQSGGFGRVMSSLGFRSRPPLTEAGDSDSDSAVFRGAVPGVGGVVNQCRGSI